MNDKIKIKNGNSELFDWMLAIDLDLAECRCSRKSVNLIADIFN